MSRTLIEDLPSRVGTASPLMVQGRIHVLRDKGRIAFLEIRDRTGSVQAVIENINPTNPLKLHQHDIVSLEGTPRVAQVRTGIPGIEFSVNQYAVLSETTSPYPIAITPKTEIGIEQELEHRVLSLRNPKNTTIFRVASDLANHTLSYARAQGFTQIFSPKIVPQTAESGANMFRLDYFGRPAFLAQSPQFYKQIMVGTGLERVIEIGPVFRAEKHDTSRHLNEYTSIDLEMAYIDSYEDIMAFEEALLKNVLGHIQETHGEVMRDRFGTAIDIPERIPRIPLRDAIAIIKREYNHSVHGEDLDPKGEKLITEHAKKEYVSDFVFVTKYPRSVRPFYAMPSADNSELTDSFDLIYRGIEITTGGQRIHNHDDLLASAARHGIACEGIEKYLDAFKYGMPPHGGMGIGLERLTSRILNLENVKYASLFPRDIRRCTP